MDTEDHVETPVPTPTRQARTPARKELRRRTDEGALVLLADLKFDALDPSVPFVMQYRDRSPIRGTAIAFRGPLVRPAAEGAEAAVGAATRPRTYGQAPPVVPLSLH